MVDIYRLQQELEVKQHSLSLLQERIAGSESAQLADSVAGTQRELEEAKAAAAAAQQKKQDMHKAAQVRQSLLYSTARKIRHVVRPPSNASTRHFCSHSKH